MPASSPKTRAARQPGNAPGVPLSPSRFGDEKATRARILYAALQVFAARGFEAASLREITEKAGVNVAAIHYHFGSREILVQELMRAVAGPLNQLRLDALDRACAQGAPGLEAVVEALVGPPVRLSFEATGEPRLLIRLLIQARALPQEATNHAIFEQYDALAIRFVDAMLQAEPALPREEAFWRYAFAIGALMYIVSDSDQQYHRLHRISGGLCNTDDPQAIVRQLVAFITAGIRARP
ncbi:TetR/AcrR family transcriptional regulator [Variovorax terrae]|uniref:TetR family transcriptional regulator n=1 Tax=Variovorax terrae TaxID=2923278 RepID=A0A9X1VVJ0_9BURK|nr:TetR/AcrR family transcriptional regulator [Variovorax terrae]MCJ0764023.1 TetR family transcriptional regulator [Variovorax terrae]